MQQEQAFTNEGAPPPGVVGIDRPAARPVDHDVRTHVAAQAMHGPVRLESLEALEKSIRTAEEERDALNTFSQEDLYLSACLRVDALERQLELRLVDPAGSESSVPEL